MHNGALRDINNETCRAVSEPNSFYGDLDSPNQRSRLNNNKNGKKVTNQRKLNEWHYKPVGSGTGLAIGIQADPNTRTHTYTVGTVLVQILKLTYELYYTVTVGTKCTLYIGPTGLRKEIFWQFAGKGVEHLWIWTEKPPRVNKRQFQELALIMRCQELALSMRFTAIRNLCNVAVNLTFEY